MHISSLHHQLLVILLNQIILLNLLKYFSVHVWNKHLNLLRFNFVFQFAHSKTQERIDFKIIKLFIMTREDGSIVIHVSRVQMEN